MACQLVYRDGKVTGALTPSGKVSKLFKDIVSNPHVQTFAEGVEVYKNTFIDKIVQGEVSSKLSASNSSNYANLTEDGEGNFVFYHYSLEERTEIDPSKYGGNSVTSKEEVAAIGKVGGVAMFYTNNHTSEPGVTGVKHMIKVPMEKVYDFNTDADNLIVEARELFKKEYPDQAFSPNVQLAYITKIANEKGYDMVVAEWGDDKTRAQTTKKLPINDIQKINGNAITKAFEQDYESNSSKGYIPMVGKTQGEVLNEVYNKINRELSATNTYGKLYRLYYEYSKYTQDEITDEIEKSNISQEVKDEYKVALEVGEAVRESVMDIEPNLEYRVGDIIYDTFRDALKNTQGQIIEVVAGDLVLFEINSNTNVNTVSGFINHYIKTGLMSDKRMIENGETYLQAEGTEADQRAVNEHIIDEDAKSRLGTANRVVTNDGKITLRDVKGKVTLDTNSGAEATVEIKDFESMSTEEIEEKFEESNMILAALAVKESILSRTYGGQTLQGATAINLNEEELTVRLLSLLEKMGVKVTTLEEYLKNSAIRNGVEPSANALSDLANQIIALKNGTADTSALLEETAHFIVEAWNQGDITNLLRNIHNTDEYIEFAEQYREIYRNQTGSEQELEELVRREVLGKVLANSLRDGFSTENTTANKANIIEYIKNLFVEFMTNVANQFTTQNEMELSRFTRQVQDLVLNQDIDSYLNMNNLGNKKFVMYQANGSSGNTAVDDLVTQTRALVNTLQQQEKDVLRAGKGLQSNVKRLKELETTLEEATIKKSIATLLDTASRQTQYISDSADVANNNGNFLTNEEGVVWHSLRKVMSPTLSQINNYLIAQKSQSNNAMIAEMDKIIANIGRIEGKLKNQGDSVLDKVIDRIMVRHGFKEDVRAELKKATEAAVADTTAFYATFGQLSHAKDPVLNMAGSIIHDLTFDANVSHLRAAKGFQKRIKDLGFEEKDVARFFDKGYIIDIRDWKAYEEAEEKVYSETFAEALALNPTAEQSALPTLTPQQIIDLRSNPKAHKGLKLPRLTAEQQTKYNKDYKDKMSPLRETVFDEQYYKDEEAKYKDHNISELTMRERRDLSIDRGHLLSRVKEYGGTLRFRNQDKIDMNALNLKRKNLKNFHTELGVRKQGIKIEDGVLTEKYSKTNPDVIEVNGKIITLDRSVAEDSAIIAFDLHKLDLIFQDEGRQGSKELSKKFKDQLESIELNEGREAALEFFRLNSYTGFSEEYWDSLGDKDGVVAKLSSLNTPESETLKTILGDHLYKRKQILKQFQSQQDASDTLVSDMPIAAKEEVINLTVSIEKSFEEASKLLSEGQETEEQQDVKSENTPNEAYHRATEGMTVQEKIDFALKNMTAEGRRRVQSFEYSLDDLRNKGKVLTKGKQALYDRFQSRTHQDTVLNYAESKVAAYYTRFAPQGFSEYQNRLENTAESITSIATEMNENPMLQLTNNFSYEEVEDQAYRNKDFKSDYEGGYTQPKLSAFKNARFEEMFSPNVVDGEVVSVGKNENLYELYKETLEYHRSSLAAMGELGSHNLFKAPQISKTRMEKMSSFSKQTDKKKAATEFIKDSLFYRVDDLAYGEEIAGESIAQTTGARFIPKYYMRDLENKDDVSTDLFYSLTSFGQQAYLYQSRKNYFSDMMAIEESLTGRENYPDGKGAEASATLKMFRSAMDGYLFGIQESKQLKVTLPIVGTVDLTKNIRFIHKWIMNRNLGFNLVVPFTSWVTAEAQNGIEKYVGEYINKHSTGLAKVEFGKLAQGAFSEKLEINSKAKINVMGEHFGIYDISNRYPNTIYAKIFRKGLGDIGMMLNQAANFPIIPRVMLTVLYDYRVVNGDLVNFNQFEATEKEAGVLNKTQIVEKWKTVEDKALYNYMNVSETNVTYDLAKMKADMNNPNFVTDLQIEQFMEQKERGVTARIREMAKFIDGQVPEYERSAAQRHFFLSFFTTHRGWLSIAYARRFKNKHLNLQTGQREQGSYRTVADFAAKTFQNLYEGSFKDFMKDIKTQWDEADDVERGNMKRVMVELSFLQGMVGIGWLIAMAAGDEDNKDLYALQLSNYMYFRLMNETTSAQTSIGSQFYEMIKSPIVGADTVKSIFSIQNYFDNEEIKSGRYAGMKKYQKQFMSVVPGYKSAIDLANPRDAYNSYKHFNPSVQDYNPILWLLETE